jgi:hypothetical protein
VTNAVGRRMTMWYQIIGVVLLLIAGGITQVAAWNKPHNFSIMLEYPWYSWVLLALGTFLFFFGWYKIEKEKNEPYRSKIKHE